MSSSLVPQASADDLQRGLSDSSPTIVAVDRDGGDEGASPISGQAILGSLRRWWTVALPAGFALSLLAAAGIYLTSEPEYRAAAWLKIRADSPYVVFKEEESSSVDAGRFIETQIELIRSPMVVAPLLSDPEIAGLAIIREQDDPLAWLASEVGVLQRGDSELFRISFQSPDANAAKTIIDALAKSYLDFRSRQEVETKRRVFTLLQREKEKYYKEIKRVRTNLQTLVDQSLREADAAALAGGERGGTLVQQSLSRLVAIDLERFSLQAEMDRKLEPTLDSVELEAIVTEKLATDALLAQSRAELAMVVSELERLESVLRRPERSTEYASLKERSLTLQQTVAAREREISSQTRFAAARQQAKAEREQKAEFDMRLAELNMQQEHLKAVLEEELKKAQQNEGGESLEIEFLRDELELSEQMQQEISSRITRLQVESQAVDRVELLRAGAVEGTPVVGTPWKKMAGAACMAWIFPFAIAFVAERALRRVCDTRSLEAHASAPVLCEISRLPAIAEAKSDRAQAQLEEALRVFEESTNVLATTVRWAEGFRGVRVLAVASAMRDEGKTTLATQLAICLTEAGGKTLLIDGDIRSPDIHDVFGVSVKPGLADVLGGSKTLDEAISPTEHPGLWVLPAGTPGGKALRLFGELSGRVIEAAREGFEHVVIDTAPLLQASEAILAARAADAAILCAMRDKSRGEHVREAGRRLEAAGGRLAGVVLNGVPTRNYKSRYGEYPASSVDVGEAETFEAVS